MTEDVDDHHRGFLRGRAGQNGHVYAAALAGINQTVVPEPATHIALPLKSEPPRGKRSTAGLEQKAVLLKEDSIERATERMKRRNRRTDISDLMQALLDAWLQTLE